MYNQSEDFGIGFAIKLIKLLIVAVVIMGGYIIWTMI